MTDAQMLRLENLLKTVLFNQQIIVHAIALTTRTLDEFERVDACYEKIKESNAIVWPTPKEHSNGT